MAELTAYNCKQSGVSELRSKPTEYVQVSSLQEGAPTHLRRRHAFWLGIFSGLGIYKLEIHVIVQHPTSNRQVLFDTS